MNWENMNKQIKVTTIFLFLLLAMQNCLAQFSAEQQNKMLELKSIINDKSSNDTTKAAAYVNLSEFFGVSNRDSMYALSVTAQQIAEKALTKKPTKAITYSLKVSLSSAFNNIGYFYKSQGNSALALEYYQKSINILEEIDYKLGLGSSYNNIGLLYYTQGNIPLAIEYYHKSLKIREKIEDKKGIATVFHNLGFLYQDQNNIPQAIDFYTKCLKICEEIGDKKGLAYSYNNMGVLHFLKNDFPSAINYHLKSIKIKEEIGDRRGISESYHNIARVYQSSLHNSSEEADSLAELAMEYFLKSLAIKEEINDKIGLATTLFCIGQLELSKGLLEKAKANGERALTIAKEIGFVIEIQRAASLLYDIALQQENWKEALEMRNLQLQMKDSITSEEAMKAGISQQAKYEYEKQKVLDDAEHEKQLTIEQEAKVKQKIITYSITGSLGLVVVFLIFVFNRLQITRKQKAVIEVQKTVVEKAHQEIRDSINYAKRIQSAILPPLKLVKEYLPESFILYKPKDVVAGDFYWLEQKESLILFAAADCTGHGVPGAMVSVICNNGLNRSVKEYELTDPGKILDKTREIVIQEFEKSEEDVKDGMDIALCSLRFEVRGLKLKDSETVALLQYAGANNSLWIIRNKEFIEYKPNKQPIGKVDNPEPYTTHSITLQKGDTIYIFTDGFADQFGGAKGKKFMYKPFKELLLSIQDKTMDEQKIELEQHFENWKGSLEQVDDVCVIGVRI